MRLALCAALVITSSSAFASPESILTAPDPENIREWSCKGLLTSLSDKSKHETGGTLRFTGVKSRETIVSFKHTAADGAAYAATGYMDFSELWWVTRGVLVEEAGVITRFEAPSEGKDGWIWRGSMTGVPGYGYSEMALQGGENESGSKFTWTTRYFKDSSDMIMGSGGVEVFKAECTQQQ